MDRLQEQLSDLKERLDSLVGGINTFTSNLFLNRDLSFAKGRKIVGAIFPGSIASDGTAISLPAGWTSAKTATGKYTITHNMSLSNYVVVGGPSDSLADEHDINTKTSTSFRVETLLAGAFADCTFDFILMLY